MTLRERIFAKIRMNEEAGCWEWLGAKSKTGHTYYGFIGVAGKNALAHRVMYQLERGAIPDGLTLDHLCRNTLCVNPAHLEPVSNRENTRRGMSPAAMNMRKTHCPKGHAYDADNTLEVRGRYGTSWRQCRECGRKRARVRGRFLYVKRRDALHCRNGHSRTMTIVRSSGKKVCMACVRAQYTAKRTTLGEKEGVQCQKQGTRVWNRLDGMSPDLSHQGAG